MKKQTAVEWYSQQHLKLLIKLENKELSIGEYAVQHQELFNQANKMFEQQIIDAIIFFKERPHLEINAEQYYNETFRVTIIK
jgi:hypothetical protein